MSVLDRILKRDAKTEESSKGIPTEPEGDKHEEYAKGTEQPEKNAMLKSAEEAAKYLLQLEQEGKLRYDMRDYIESRDFAELMSQHEISAAVRIYEAERFANEAYQAGRDEAIDEIYKRREMPRAMRSGTGAQADLDYMRMSEDEFSRLRDRLARS